jgi:hypothetical protein
MPLTLTVFLIWPFSLIVLALIEWSDRRHAAQEHRRAQALEALAARDAQRDMRVAAVFETFAARQASPITELDREWLNDLGIVA